MRTTALRLFFLICGPTACLVGCGGEKTAGVGIQEIPDGYRNEFLEEIRMESFHWAIPWVQRETRLFFSGTLDSNSGVSNLLKLATKHDDVSVFGSDSGPKYFFEVGHKGVIIQRSPPVEWIISSLDGRKNPPFK